ncbi:unnamed protein product [Discula destructiva]
MQGSTAGLWALGALSVYLAFTIIYNLFFHPLRQYPGPLLYRASRLPRAFRILLGKWPRELVELTEKYGSVVRVAPTMLVYTDADAWKDIMGPQNGASVKGDEFGKELFFYRSRVVRPNILSETRENHALLRRQLSHGFSDKSLRAQEGVIKGYVDLFIQGLREEYAPNASSAKGSVNKLAVDLRHWFNYVTFDIIGDLALGEPFGCLEKGETGPLIAHLEAGLASARFTYFAKEMGLKWLLILFAFRVAKLRQTLGKQMFAVLQRRMELDHERPDLIHGMIKEKGDRKSSLDRLHTNAPLLIIAGSETTATLLTGTTYLLLKNPETFQKLKDEIRSAFRSEDEITFASVEHLPYMLAVFKESLRYYPPVAGEMPRVVPTGGATVAGRFVPAGTTVAPVQYAMNHAPSNFQDSYDFRPERFLQPENFPHDNFDVLQPFSYGPRNCIGKNLAYAEMRMILVRLVWAFDMELVDPDEEWMDQKVFFLWTKPPLNVHLTPVQRP